MSDQPRKSKRPAVAAAVSMLGLSLGVTGADAQYGPAGGKPQGNTRGVLIGLNQPGSNQYKSQQLKSQQLKSQQLKSEQYKSQQYKTPASNQIKSQQLKSQQFKSQQYKMPGK